MSKQFKSMAALMEASPPATVKAPKKAAKAPEAVTQQQLVVQLPAETVKAVKVKAAEDGTTVRAILLQALDAAGFPVPAGQTNDLRKVKA